jgi:hypothetical protein
MAKKDKTKEQSERFIKKAKELDSDESGETFDRAVKKIVPPTRRRDKSALRISND